MVRLELAGVKPDSLSLSLAGQELLVKGRRQPPPPEGIRRFIHLEMGFGAFERCFILPIPIDPQGVQARFLDGILEITLPRKAPADQPNSGEAGRLGIITNGEPMATEEQDIQAPLLGDQEIHPSPRVLSILPMPDLVLFPRMIMPIVLWDEPSQKLVQEALFQDKIFGVLASRGQQGRGLRPGRPLPGGHRRRHPEDAQSRRRLRPPAGSGACTASGWRNGWASSPTLPPRLTPSRRNTNPTWRWRPWSPTSRASF